MTNCARPFVAVVDDDEAVRVSVAMLLDHAGYEVSAFADAQSFLDAVPGLPAGPVVTDVRMPRMSGVEMMSRLKAIGEEARPVIVITAHGNVVLAVSAMRAGAIDVLEKPFEAGTLLQALKTAAGASQARASETPLTTREREVATGVMRGQTSKAIAQDLGISYRTVQVVRARLLKKTGAANTAALISLLQGVEI